jgi:TolB-like protein/class 3 adenylate cyclase
MAESRHLAAIMFTDIVGYTATMQEDEPKALRLIRQYTTALKSTVAAYAGIIVNDYGDGNLCTFPSVTEAVRCAMALQKSLQAGQAVPLRIGLHIGEVFFEGGKALGDGINVASRIQSLGVGNSILFSAEVYGKISNQPEFKAVSLGKFHFKNVSSPMEVFSLANEGLAVPDRAYRDGKLKERPGVRKWAMWIGAISVAVVLLLYLTVFNQPDQNDNRKSVAVLAFEDLSPEKDQEWFSDGLSEEIINSLANLKGLKVVARTSSFYFKGKDVPFSELAEKLGVDHLVEGSVRIIDGQLRITVQLISAKDGLHLFSNTYDRPKSDLFVIQREIADSVAGKLLSTLSPDGQSVESVQREVPSTSEAYAYYLKGWHARNDAKPLLGTDKWMDKLKSAESLLVKSISLDGDYTPAYAALATLYNDFGERRENRKKYMPLRDSVLRIGLTINAQSTSLLIAQALAVQNYEQPDLDSVFSLIRKAYFIDSGNSSVKSAIGAFYIRIGLTEEGIKFLKRARETDPLDMSNRLTLARIPMFLGDLDQAELELKNIIELDSRYETAYRNMVLVYIRRGDFKGAKEKIRVLEEMGSKLAPSEYALYLAAQGQREEALKLDQSESILSVLGMKAELMSRLDTVILKQRFTGSLSRQVIYTSTGLAKSPIWKVIRDEQNFKRIQAWVKKDHDEKLKRYGTLR